MRLALCLLALPLAVLAEDKPLPLVLPKSVALGTPKPMKIDNLEPPAKGPRVLPKVPAEAKNLALGCPVTSSAKEAAAGDFSYLTDGDKGGEEGFEVDRGLGLADGGSEAVFWFLGVEGGNEGFFRFFEGAEGA